MLFTSSYSNSYDTKSSPDRMSGASRIVVVDSDAETKTSQNLDSLRWTERCFWKVLTLLKTMAVLYRTLLFGSTSKPPDMFRSKS